MSADQDPFIHKVVTAAGGDEGSFVLVVREALDEVEARGRRQGYADALRDQHHAQWLADARKRRVGQRLREGLFAAIGEQEGRLSEAEVTAFHVVQDVLDRTDQEAATAAGGKD